jgi:hypothetical protein
MPHTQCDNPASISELNSEEMADETSELAAQHREFVSKLAERQSSVISSEDPDFETIGSAFPSWADPGRDAILQPPKPQIHPSEAVMGRIVNRRPDIEAAD